MSAADDAIVAAHFAQGVARLLAPPGAEDDAVRRLRAEDLPDMLAHLRERLAQARAEGEAAGAARERAAVVAYLRAHPSVAERRGGQHVGVGPNPAVARFVLREAVPDIEAGEHVGAAGCAA